MSKAGCSANPEQPGLAALVDATAHLEGPDDVGAAAGDAEQPAGVALADQRRAVGEERDAPRDREPGDHLAGDLRVGRLRPTRSGVGVGVSVGVGVGVALAVVLVVVLGSAEGSGEPRDCSSPPHAARAASEAPAPPRSTVRLVARTPM